MSFSSRRRNYLLTPHRRDGLLEWMKSMLQHSFVLDALDATASDTFTHFEMLIEEHRQVLEAAVDAPDGSASVVAMSRLQQLVPTVGRFHTALPLRRAFEIYNQKHRLTKRKHIQVSFNEIRHIMNLAQVLALASKVPEDQARELLLASSSASTTVSSLIHFRSTKNINNKPHSQQEGSLPFPDDATPTTIVEESEEEEDYGIGLALETDDLTEDKEDTMASSLCTTPTTSEYGAASSTSTTEQQEHLFESSSCCDIFHGPKLVTFDADQTLYLEGQDFETNPPLARYMELLLRHGVTVAIITSSGYECTVQKYEDRLSGLLNYLRYQKISPAECERFFVLGGECNYLFQLGSDYKLHAVNERGPGGWVITTQFIPEAPGNWSKDQIDEVLYVVEVEAASLVENLGLEDRAWIVRNERAVGVVPKPGIEIPRETLDEIVLCLQEEVNLMNQGKGPGLPYSAFNGGSEVWLGIGNKRVGVQMMQSYFGVAISESLHIGDHFVNEKTTAGNAYFARSAGPCVWVTNPQETTYLLKSILRLASVNVQLLPESIAFGEYTFTSRPGISSGKPSLGMKKRNGSVKSKQKIMNFAEIQRRDGAALRTNAYES